MTLTADFSTGRGAVLRNARPSESAAARHTRHVSTPEEFGILPSTETRIFTIFPERAVRVRSELSESFRRKICLIGMFGPTSVFLALTAWYLSL